MTRALLLVAATAALLAATVSQAAAPVPHVATIALDGSDVRVLSGSEPASAPRFAHDGRILFFRPGSAFKWDLWVMNADGSRARRLAGGPEGYGPIAWSPTGATFATTEWDASPCSYDSRNCAIAEIRVHDAASGDIRARLRSRGAYQYSWSPDGRRIASLGELDQDLSAYTVEVAGASGTGRRVLVRTRFPNFLSEIAWSPRGDRIAYVQRGWIWLVRPTGGKTERVTRGGRLLWSPRGQLLYSVGGARRLLNPATKRSRLLFYSPAEIVAWSADGTRLVYREGYVDGATTLTVVRSSNGGILSRLTVAGDVTGVSFAPGGSRLVYGVRFD